ncbi:MAG TPA: hypothetical protein VGL57_04340 [Solirubrobacteraceae bacterium]|jgi:hypothetical protein
MSRFGPRRRDAIYELRITVAAIDKLAARGISVRDTEQLINNRYVIRRNTGRRHRDRRKLAARRLVTGHTDGGQTLTLVVERTQSATSWLIITGWVSTNDERRIVED